MAHQTNCISSYLAPTCAMLELYSITIPNAKSAATQNASIVTAAFMLGPQTQPTPAKNRKHS